MEEMRRQLAALQQQMTSASVPAAACSSTPPVQAAAAIEDLRERQAIEETQIATQEQTKVESASKYPVKLSGLLLFNGFVNTRQVDMAATPTLALPGPGSTGASVRQTLLGVDARGPVSSARAATPICARISMPARPRFITSMDLRSVPNP